MGWRARREKRLSFPARAKYARCHLPLRGGGNRLCARRSFSSPVAKQRWEVLSAVRAKRRGPSPRSYERGDKMDSWFSLTDTPSASLTPFARHLPPLRGGGKPQVLTPLPPTASRGRKASGAHSVPPHRSAGGETLRCSLRSLPPLRGGGPPLTPRPFSC